SRQDQPRINDIRRLTSALPKLPNAGRQDRDCELMLAGTGLPLPVGVNSDGVCAWLCGGPPRKLTASAILELTQLSCRQSASAIRQRLSRCDMKNGSRERSRRGEKISSGTHSGAAPPVTISTAANPAAVQ